MTPEGEDRAKRGDCKTCNGTGWRQDRGPNGHSDPWICSICGGTGERDSDEPAESRAAGGEGVPLDENDCPMPRCPECSAYHELVRPGKTQPTCLCEAYRRELENNAAMAGLVDYAEERLHAALGELAALKAKAERPAELMEGGDGSEEARAKPAQEQADAAAVERAFREGYACARETLSLFPFGGLYESEAWRRSNARAALAAARGGE